MKSSTLNKIVEAAVEATGVPVASVTIHKGERMTVFTQDGRVFTFESYADLLKARKGVAS
jgi:hypothetical protein